MSQHQDPAGTIPAATPAPLQLPTGFGASRHLQRQMKTGRMATAGNGASIASTAAEPDAQLAAPDSVASPSQASAPRSAATPLGFGFARSEPSEPAIAIAHGAKIPSSSAHNAPRAGFESVVKSGRETGAAKVHISTVKLLTRLLGAVAARPGIMAEEQVRTETLRSLHRQATTLGDALARRCALDSPVPDWLRAQAVDSAASTLCMAWEGGLSSEQIRAFEHTLASQIGQIAQEAEAVAGRVGFNGYQVADSVETAQARLYISVTAAIGRLAVSGVPVDRAARAVAEIVAALDAEPSHVSMKLDLRTAWLQGSLGRCTDLMTAVLQSKALATGGEDRVTFAQRQALSLLIEVETYAQNLIQRKFGESDGPVDGDEAAAGTLPRAG